MDKGVLIIFPSGSVSTAKNLKSRLQMTWKTFPTKLIHQTKQMCYQSISMKKRYPLSSVASKLNNQTLKYSSYIHETKKLVRALLYTLEYDKI